MDEFRRCYWLKCVWLQRIALLFAFCQINDFQSDRVEFFQDHNCTLTSHFNRYILPLPDWSAFLPNSSWHRNIPQVHIGVISITAAAHLWSEYHKGSLWLESGDCGGHSSTVDSLSCSRNQIEMSFVVWCVILQDVVTRTCALWLFLRYMILANKKCGKKITLWSTPPLPVWTTDLRHVGSILSCFSTPNSNPTIQMAL